MHELNVGAAAIRRRKEDADRWDGKQLLMTLKSILVEESRNMTTWSHS